MPHTLSVSCPLLVQRITGMLFVASSRASVRVAWKPFWPGSTTSISTRSGRDCWSFFIASSALSAVTTLKPLFNSMSLRNWRSVGESSTMRIFLMAMRCLSGNVFADCGKEPFLGEGLGEVAVGARQAAARAVEHAILGRQHDHRRRLQLRVLLDERASLVAVEARHHDVDEDDARLVIGDLGERIEAVLGEDHFVSGLPQEKFGAAPNGVAIVDDQNLDGSRLDRPRFRLRCRAHAAPFSCSHSCIC